ncbi:MAG: hypothetical protein ACWGNO_15835 [Desulfobacterales bacterium]
MQSLKITITGYLIVFILTLAGLAAPTSSSRIQSDQWHGYIPASTASR